MSEGLMWNDLSEQETMLGHACSDRPKYVSHIPSGIETFYDWIGISWRNFQNWDIFTLISSHTRYFGCSFQCIPNIYRQSRQHRTIWDVTDSRGVCLGGGGRHLGILAKTCNPNFGIRPYPIAQPQHLFNHHLYPMTSEDQHHLLRPEPWHPEQPWQYRYNKLSRPYPLCPCSLLRSRDTPHNRNVTLGPWFQLCKNLNVKTDLIPSLPLQFWPTSWWTVLNNKNTFLQSQSSTWSFWMFPSENAQIYRFRVC